MSRKFVTRSRLTIVLLFCAVSGLSSAQAPQIRVQADPRAVTAALSGFHDMRIRGTAVDLAENPLERSNLGMELGQGGCVNTRTAMRVSRFVDETPLERPLPLAIMEGERMSSLREISRALRDLGFSVTINNLDSGEMRLVRNDGQMDGARDELLIWADGQAGDAEAIRIYVEYGRFETIWGQGVQRIRVTQDEILDRVGPAREAIVELSEGV